MAKNNYIPNTKEKKVIKYYKNTETAIIYAQHNENFKYLNNKHDTIPKATHIEKDKNLIQIFALDTEIKNIFRIAFKLKPLS